MNDSDGDGVFDREWEEQDDLSWNEFDWEQYLRQQDLAIERYLACYAAAKGRDDRIDEAAHLMGWDESDWSVDETTEAEEPIGSLEPYTLLKNPVFIATRGIYLGIRRSWEKIAKDPDKTPQALALLFQSALHRGEDQAMLAIQSLDFGDYALAISLFKRSLRELNTSLSLIDDTHVAGHPALEKFRAEALPMLFDVREIWLRVIAECREEIGRDSGQSD